MSESWSNECVIKTTIVKLRIRNNSVRLRLMQGEVDSFADSGRVSATTAFAGGRELHYALERSDSVDSVQASFADNEIRIRVPDREALQWTGSDAVSLCAEQAVAGGDSLSILVEKDFACLKPREGEDESDMYPHPKTEGQ